jgi:aminomethyltransferase
LCRSFRWKDWAGHVAVSRYEGCHEAEYYAFRQSAGLIDVSPLYKYDVRGPDAATLLRRMMVRDIGKLRVGKVTYCCWCDDRGKVLDDGTVARLDDDWYRVTATEPGYHWLARLGRGLGVEIEDTSRSIAALALQGPNSRAVLAQCCDAALEDLRFFGATRACLDGVEVWITRTGYTGDLGYEVWGAREDALRLWDAILDAGRAFGARPCGLDALDMTRIEAGFILAGVDYFQASTVVVESRKSTPDEIGLGWTVDLDRDPFVGQAAIRAERSGKPKWRLVGLDVDWAALEAIYDRYGLPTHLPAEACRAAVPVYQGRRQVGQATSHTWSPILKRQISLASIQAGNAAIGTELEIEHTVEFERLRTVATVVKTPFFNPERKRKP